MTRREVREVAFMLLFQLEFRQDVSIDDTLLQYYTMDADSSDDEEEIPEVKLSQKDREYIDAVIKGVGEKKSELDSVITEYAKGWSLERIIKVDLSVLRYCIYEMKYMADRTPLAVSINEAVEISKKYGTEKSKSFVNGVLSSFYKALTGEK
ncbi:MAG: transcription antitermination factor NusB [Clostridia bacterium]|nr:transcription antitermination factor NusB [Clostridia bacterium]